ncbi:MAG: DNA-processing protein DprA [Candidatus Saelkia tenebricola]|nr:DNA-processing protein DprA [Candidatus Saelkia tenebricola]
MEEKHYLLALNMISGLGSLKISRLLNSFAKAEDVFHATEKDLQNIFGIGNEITQRIKKFDRSSLEKELQLCKKYDIKIMTIMDSGYPDVLREIPDSPIVLYYKGNLDVLDFNFAVVGSRKASSYGLSIAEKFSYQLADLGVVIVSGMARGIDTAAHTGALKAKGKTVAVLGSGLLNIYPSENNILMEKIAATGVVITEFPLHSAPLRENFPRRNRIVSGLSRGVLVVEAAERSGALITADLALDQGRDVFAVPGKVDSPTSFGANYLIKQGAKLVNSIEDILEEYNLSAESNVSEGV